MGLYVADPLVVEMWLMLLQLPRFSLSLNLALQINHPATTCDQDNLLYFRDGTQPVNCVSRSSQHTLAHKDRTQLTCCNLEFTMSAAPLFWSHPLKYCRWASYERPALFWSVMIGAAGPVMIPIIRPIRAYFGDVDAPAIPVTYPGTLLADLQLLSRQRKNNMANLTGGQSY